MSFQSSDKVVTQEAQFTYIIQSESWRHRLHERYDAEISGPALEDVWEKGDRSGVFIPAVEAKKILLAAEKRAVKKPVVTKSPVKKKSRKA